MHKLKILLLNSCLFVFTGGAIAQTVTTRIFLVRHADREQFDDLNAPGLVRAKELKRMLGGTGIDSIFSTNFIRTKKTVTPLASALNLPVTLYNNDTLLIKKALNFKTGKTILITGHSNTVPPMIQLCGCHPPFENIPDTQFDDVFLLIIQQNKPGQFPKSSCKLLHMKYGANTTASKSADPL